MTTGSDREHVDLAGLRCEHGFVKPCTECDPYVAAKAMAKGLPVASPSGGSPE